MTEKPLPNNREAERSVLGAILLDNSKLAEVSAALSSGDFFLGDHQTIFRAMLALGDASSPIDLTTLHHALENKGQLVAAGGLGYVAQLMDGQPRVSNLSHYCQIVHEKAQLRHLLHKAAEIQRRILSGDVAPADLAGDLELAAKHASNGKPKTGAKYLEDFRLSDFLTADFPVPTHLVEQLIPAHGTGLIVALPHRLKSYFTTALALAATRAGTKIMGLLEVQRPVRTYIAQLEDWPGEVQARIQRFMLTEQFQGCEPENIRVLPRTPNNTDFNLPDEGWYQALLARVAEFKADLVIIDVVRRIFRGDINSPKETAAFLEQVDRLRSATDCSVLLVHHENKKGEEIMTAGAGSYNLPGWANVMIQFKRKTTEGNVTRVEIEVDNKLAQSPEPMRMSLDFGSAHPVQIETLDEGVGLDELRERLQGEFTVRDVMEALDIHKTNAYRRMKKWELAGHIERVSKGNAGRRGGLARYRLAEGADIGAIASIRHVN